MAKVFTNKKLDKITTEHDYNIISFDFRKTPGKVHEGIKDWEFVQTLPIVRITNARKIALNESFPGYQKILVFLLSLNQMPDSLLLDIFHMDAKKYPDVDLFSGVEGESADDTKRRLIYCLIPEILYARGNETIESKLPYQK